jgi:5-methylcytosine-specific restriction endonuclease McrA
MKEKIDRFTEERLRERWGRDIPIYDEGDPNYIPVSEDWLPIPLIIDEKTHRKNMKRLEAALTNPTGVRSIKVSVTSEYSRFRKNRLLIPQYVKDLILEERGNMCEHCRQNRYDQWHHKNNNPSDNQPQNLEILCYHCHKLVHKRHGYGG